MKVKFSKTKEFIPEYNGNAGLPPEDQFKAELRVLSTGDLLNVMDALQSSGVQGKVDTDKVSTTNMKEVVALIPALLPKYVTIRNLRAEDGTELSVEDVIGVAFFLPLQVELLLQLSVISTPSEEAVGNSNPPPAS